MTEVIIEKVRAYAAELEAEAMVELEEAQLKAEKGDVSDIYYVGYLLTQGDYVPKDTRRASVWYAKGAALDCALCMTNLGCIRGEQGDQRKATGLYKRAAGLGDSLAMLNLARQYMWGKGVEEDLAESKRWAEQAHEESLISAAVLLAELMRKEAPVANAFQAAALLREAAEGDHTEGQYQWGLSLWHGDGVEADSAAAERWMCIAAHGGHGMAQGWLREHGQQWIPHWPVDPLVSFGSLRFERPIDPFRDSLELKVSPRPGEDDGEETLWSRTYGFDVELKHGRLVSVDANWLTDVAVTFQGFNLKGADLGQVLERLSASDWEVDKGVVSHADLSSESLGVDLMVTDERVIGVRAVSSDYWNDDEL